MSHLSGELAAVAKKNGIKQIDISRRTDLSVAHVSRIFNGEQVTVTEEDLSKFLAAVAKSPEDRARIIKARMLDVYTGPDADLVEIRLRTKAKDTGKEKWPGAAIDP